MEQRVAITGIGAVSPLGNTALATWAAMCAGTCGIGPITHFDTDAFAVKVAAEVKGFDGNEYFGKRDAKHLDPCVQFAMAASDEAMHDAGFDVEGAIDRERLGVYVGSGVGGMTTLVDNVHTIAERGPRRASPYMIAMMIPNMASGNIAIRHKAKGPTLPVVTRAQPRPMRWARRSAPSSTAMPTRSSRAAPRLQLSPMPLRALRPAAH